MYRGRIPSKAVVFLRWLVSSGSIDIVFHGFELLNILIYRHPSVNEIAVSVNSRS